MQITMLKKILFAILAIALLFCVMKRHKIKKSFLKFYSNNFYQGLVDYKIIKKCYVSHPDIIQIFAQEGLNYESLSQEITATNLKKLNNLNIETASKLKIPTISHKIYFTPKNNQVELNAFYIEELKTSFNGFNNLGIAWKHIIWTNQPDLFPKEITNIKGVEVKSIDEFKNHQSYDNLLKILDKANDFKPHLAEATDLVRLMVVQEYGGVYSDMDYEIYNPKAFFELMKKFDFVGTKEEMSINGFYSNAFFAAKPNHPILNDALEKYYRNYNLDFNNKNIPDYVKYPCNIYDKILFNGPVLITISYFAKNNIDGNSDMIMPSWMMMNREFARLKNNDCKLSEITPAYFQKNQRNLHELFRIFNSNQQVESWQKANAWQFINNLNNPLTQTIYYNLKDHAKFKIIGADASCGSWIMNETHHKYYYWNFLFIGK